MSGAALVLPVSRARTAERTALDGICTKPINSSLFRSIPERPRPLAAERVLYMFLERVIVVLKRNEFIAFRAGKNAQGPGKIAGDAEHALVGFTPYEDSYYGGKQGAAYFSLCGLGQLRRVHEEGPAVRVRD